jgi:farnesyl diphosphate synthase
VIGFEERLKRDMATVETRLAELLTAEHLGDVPERLARAMRHAVLGGGKRFRPFLVIETAALFGVPREQAMAAACALECVHCYSLVHDDLPAMDNDTLRRGQPTVWTAFDEWTAILAGDALLTYAFELLSDPATHAEPLVRLALSRRLAQASGPAGMAGGQIIDLEADKLGQPAAPTLAHIQRLQAKKTGALIAYACEAGGLLGQATPAQMDALTAYGRHLGLAFQIADDLLDVEGDAIAVGKAVAKDAAAGKATLVSLMGLEPARRRLIEAERDAIAALAMFGEQAGVLRAAARFVSQRKS